MWMQPTGNMASRTCRSALFWPWLGLAVFIIAFAPLPKFSSPAAPTAHTVVIEARQFAYTPGEIRVNPGDRVTLRLVSTDVVHGLYLDGYDLSLEADPGQGAELTFVADKPGSFRFRCNVTCGAMHPFMVGKLIVGTNAGLYRAIGLATLAVIVALLLAPSPALPRTTH